MTRLEDFPITSQRLARHPDRIQLYSYPTPNGTKVSIMLEETGLPYEAHLVNLRENETGTEPFRSLNPNGKIPAIIDPNGPDGQPLALFESGAILIYLAEKSGMLLPAPPGRYETLQWVFFQAAHVGPTIGHFSWFHSYGGRELEDKRPLERFRNESIRVLGVIERRLEARRWIMGDDYTIADIQMFPWVQATRDYLKADEVLGLQNFPRTFDWVDRAAARPASKKGRSIPATPA